MAPSTFLVPPLKFTDAKKHMELSLQVQLTPTTNMEICVAEPKDTPRVMSCFNQQCSVSRCYHNIATSVQELLKFPTSLFLKANMTAPACSAALPTIGIKMMLMKLTDSSHDFDAAC